MNIKQPLENRVALITGSARGIGRAVAETFLQRGATVVINDIDRARAEETARELGPGAEAIAADVSSSSDVARLIQGALEKFGRIDILVNNAGMDRAAPLLEIDEDEWDRFIAVNLKSVYLCSRAVLPAMIRQKYGRIISMASIVARQGALNGGIHYASAKAGILGFTRTLARQVAEHNITVNAVAPGIVGTDLIRTNMKPEVLERLKKTIPLGDLASPYDVAKLIAFLASGDASYITGATVDINGGMWMG